MAWVAGAFALGYVALLYDPEPAIRMAALLLLAFASVQAGFIAHDAVDGAITRNRTLAFLFGQVFMTFATALSSSYFEFFHRNHHRQLSSGSTDSESSSTPLNRYEGQVLRKLVSGNGTLFITVMVFMRGLSFKLESLRYLLHNFRTTRSDQVFLALHVALWFGLPIMSIGVADTVVNYLLVSLFAGPYIGTVLILNHTGMSTARSMGHLPAIERTSVATRNLGTSRWSDLVFGGVNNHIEHHLFPDIPTARLRQARRITRDFCRRHGIAYSETSFLRALGEVLDYFRKLPPRRLAHESLA